MATDIFTMRAADRSWSVEHNGAVLGSYATREIALETIFTFARRASRAGHAIAISVPECVPEPDIGAPPPITLEQS
jgi:hypothetical protein